MALEERCFYAFCPLTFYHNKPFFNCHVDGLDRCFFLIVERRTYFDARGKSMGMEPFAYNNCMIIPVPTVMRKVIGRTATSVVRDWFQ
jgi:hypothetical protein